LNEHIQKCLAYAADSLPVNSNSLDVLVDTNPLKVAPLNVVGTIAADPSKETPPIDRAVVNVAAVPAEPVVFWSRVGILAASSVPVICAAGSAVSPEPLPANVVAVTVPTTSRAVVGAVVLPMEILCAE
jgi:hypothetical protein